MFPNFVPEYIYLPFRCMYYISVINASGMEMRVQSPEVHPTYASQVGYYLMRNPPQPQQNQSQPVQTVIQERMLIYRLFYNCQDFL